MKKIIVLFFLGFATNTEAQNIRKGIELTSPAERGTAGSFLSALGIENTMIGYKSGYNATSASYNVFMGNYSGYTLTTGNNNSFYGNGSGYTFKFGSSGNTCVGQGSGNQGSNGTGNQNTFIGNESGYFAPSGTYELNTFLGARSGYNFVGSSNTIIGARTNNNPGLFWNFGNKLTLLGIDAKNGTNTTLNNATAIGADATVSKDNSLVLGNLAYVGIGTSKPDHLLHLKHLPTWGGYNLYSDSRSINPNIQCSWDNAAFIVNGDYTKAIIVGRSNDPCNTEENAPWSETFHVYGNGFVEAAAYGIYSDKRFKKDIKTIENGLDVVKKLDGVSYKFNFDLAKNPNADGKPSYGFIAQEVEKIIPDAVMKNKEGFYSVNYDAIIPFLTNAIKEQQAQIEDLKKLIAQNSSNNSSTTGIGETNKSNDGYLAQNTPNPFSNNTEIKYQLPKGTQTAMLGIYDLNGSQVKMYPIIAQNNSGSITVQAQELKAGMYIYTLVVNGKAFDSKKMVLTAQ